MAQEKIKCIINGKVQNLTPAAFKLAKRFYGAVSEEEMKIAKPAELQRPLMKPTIIKPPIKQPEVIEPKEEVIEGDPKSETSVTEPEVKAGDPKSAEVKKTAPKGRPKK